MRSLGTLLVALAAPRPSTEPDAAVAFGAPLQVTLTGDAP